MTHSPIIVSHELVRRFIDIIENIGNEYENVFLRKRIVFKL